MKDASEFAKQFDNSKPGGKMPKSKSKPAPVAKAKPNPQKTAQPKKVVVAPAPKKPTKDDGRVRAGSPLKITKSKPSSAPSKAKRLMGK